MRQRAPKRGRPFAGEIEHKKRTILEKSSALFIANGFENTTVEAISKAAGVTKRTIYDHIGNKEDLFRAVCMEHLPNAMTIDYHLDIDGKSTDAALRALAVRLVDFSFSDETVTMTRMLISERHRFPDLLREAGLAMREVFSGQIRAAFQDMAERGLFPRTDNPMMAHYFYDMIVGGSMLQRLIEILNKPISDQEIDERVGIFLHGYLAMQQR